MPPPPLAARLGLARAQLAALGDAASDLERGGHAQVRRRAELVAKIADLEAQAAAEYAAAGHRRPVVASPANTPDPQENPPCAPPSPPS